MIWLSVNRDFFICRSFCDHCKSLYSKPRLFSGGITILFKDIEGKTFFLISDDDHVCSYANLDATVEALDALGFARAEVLF
jgi:hypothetical protein